MKILIISRGMPTEENPMSGIFEMDQAKALSNYGFDVTLFVLDLRSARRIRRLGIRKTIVNGVRVFIASFPVGAIFLPLKMELNLDIFHYKLKILV